MIILFSPNKSAWQMPVILALRQEHRYEGYRAVPADVTAFWRPALKNCPSKHYHPAAHRAPPAVIFGSRVWQAKSMGRDWLYRADFFGKEASGSMIEASMDLGANSFQTFWHIILPIWIPGQLLKPRDRPLTKVTVMLVVLLTAIPIILAQRLTSNAADVEGASK